MDQMLMRNFLRQASAGSIIQTIPRGSGYPLDQSLGKIREWVLGITYANPSLHWRAWFHNAGDPLKEGARARKGQGGHNTQACKSRALPQIS